MHEDYYGDNCSKGRLFCAGVCISGLQAACADGPAVYASIWELENFEAIIVCRHRRAAATWQHMYDACNARTVSSYLCSHAAIASTQAYAYM